MKKFLILTALVASTVVVPVAHAQAFYECKSVARMLFGKGPKLPGTMAHEIGFSKQKACQKARNACNWLLDEKRDNDGFPYPLAKCKRHGHAKFVGIPH